MKEGYAIKKWRKVSIYWTTENINIIEVFMGFS